MKKTLTRLAVMALVATGLVVPTVASPAAAFPDFPADCYEYFFDTTDQIDCFAQVIQNRIDDTPDAEEFNLFELRNRVRSLKLTLALARSAVSQTKFERLGLMPGSTDYIEASIDLAQLRAQVQLVRFDLAEVRQQVQIARMGVVVVT